MSNRKIYLPLLAALFSCVSLGQAHAHAFKSGQSYYSNFLEGIYVIVAYPGVLLPIIAAGLLAGLWDKNGVTRALPAFSAGIIIGIPVSALVGPQVALALIVLGIVTATLAALLSRHFMIESLSLSFLTGLLAMMTSLEGHGFFELAAFIYVGLIVAAIYVFVALAGSTRMALEKFQSGVTSIVFRVAASWIAASLLLFLAFELRG